MSITKFTLEEFNTLQSEDRYYKGRWGYMKAVCALIDSIPNVDKVLELGPYQRPMVPNSDVMDLSDAHYHDIKYLCDATKTPWPIEDNYYDLFVALQVFEHLGVCQEDVFKEVMRVSKNAILSFPYKWKHADKMHSNVNDEVISKWTLRQPILSKQLKSRRMVCLYKFD